MNLIIDFDSTFVQVEALEELAKIALQNNPEKERIIKEIKIITDLGMEGKIPFSESLSRRIAMLRATKNHLEELKIFLKNKVSSSILQNMNFFQKFRENIFIISGGFLEFIKPAVADFEIPHKNIFANSFLFDDRGNIFGANKHNPLAKDGGKILQTKKLSLPRPICVIGDGFTDYQIKEAGEADIFIAFTENVTRPTVVKKADFAANNLNEAIKYLKL